MTITREAVMAALVNVVDPELRRDIVTLNMVKAIEIQGKSIAVTVNLTTPGCPLKDHFTKDVAAKVKEAIPEAETVFVHFDSMNDEERAAVATKVRGGAEKKSSPLMEPNSRTRLIAVASGKGGVGKSTATVNLACALAKLGHNVGLMDSDIYGFSIPRMMGNMRKPILLDQSTIVPLENHGVRFISAGSLVDEDTPIIWRGPMLGKMLEQFLTDVLWGDMDYLLMDLPPGTGDVALSIAQMLPRSDYILVTTPQAAASQVAQRAAAMAQRTNQKVLGIIENMSYFVCDNCEKEHYIFGKGGADALAANLDVPVLARIPLNDAIRIGGDIGDPVVVEKPDSVAAKAYMDAAAKLVELAPPIVPAEGLRIV